MSADVERKKISPAKLAHVVFRTKTNYAAMIAWYKTVLEGELVYESPLISFLSYDDEHHRIAIINTPEAKPSERGMTGLDHVAFTYNDLGDLMATFVRLKDAGIEPFCPVNHGPTTSLYYRDPDNNQIELQVDNFETVDDATDLMRRAFPTNPLGKMFDPDEMAADILGGRNLEKYREPYTIEPPRPELITKFTGR